MSEGLVIDGYRAVLTGEPGRYEVSFPDLPGCCALGKTKEEVKSNASEAIVDWFAIGGVPDNMLEAMLDAISEENRHAELWPESAPDGSMK
jgi:hypothetical protein